MSNIVLICYAIALIAFVAWMLVSVKDKIWQKIVVLTILTLGLWGINHSFESYKGWPSTDIPTSGRVVSANIVTGVGIYVLTFEDQRDNIPTWWDKLQYIPDESPRLYKLPYSKAEGDHWEEVQGKLGRGYIVRFKGSKKKILNGKMTESDGPDVPTLEIDSPKNDLPPKEGE